MSRFIVDVENFENHNIGTKAYNLFCMRKININTPALFCVDSSFLEIHLNEYGTKMREIINSIDFGSEESLERASTHLKGIIDKIEFDKALQEEIVQFIDRNFKNTALFSIRSSSTVEDGIDNSFAGQFDTYLNISKENLFDNIKRCFGSLYSVNVLKYCYQKKIKISHLKMGVIIQGMVQADIAGVAFTVNPQGLLSEAVIVAGEGTGNLIVEDKVSATTCYYNTIDGNYYYEKQTGSPVLEKNIITGLVNSINKLKEVFGEYLDIEYAISKGVLYILQVRPITTLQIDRVIILDNSNIVESYPNISLPLTSSFAKEAYSGVFSGLAARCLSNKTLTERYSHVLKEMVACANGRMYYNINNWYTLIGALPFSKKIIPVWQEMLGISNKHYHAEKIEVGIWQKIKTNFSIVRQFLFIPQKMNKLNEKFIEVNTHFTEKYKINLSNSELAELYGSIAEKVLKNWDITLLNDMYAFIYVGLLKACFKKMRVANHEAEINKYISGITNIESMRPVRTLMELARLAVEEDVLEDLSSIKDNTSLEEYLSSNHSVFIEKFKQYIEIYGDRSLEELKLESRTFRAAPLTLVEKITEYTKDREKMININKSLQIEDSRELTDELLRRYGPIKRTIVKFLSSKAMLGIKNREISRLNRSRIYGMVRSIFITIGENLCNARLIDSAEDIFYLNISEVFGFISGESLDLKSLIAGRKDEYMMYAKLPNTSRLIFANRIFNKRHLNINSEDLFKSSGEILGTPCSNGLVTGEVIVVEDPKRVKDYKDRILVTKTTDPGWVFLITLAKGIITEKGSLLSHTAIISRELGIPSIVGVKNITRILKTGDVVKMNGNTGEIKIEKRRQKDV